MNEIRSTSLIATVFSSNKNTSITKSSVNRDFEQTLRQLEEFRNWVDEEEEASQTLSNSTMNLISEVDGDLQQKYFDVIQIIERQSIGLVNNELTDASDSQLLSDGIVESQDNYAFEAILDNAMPHWLSPGETQTNQEIAFVGASIMTLDEFTSLLEQGWIPKSTNGMQVWRFSLSNSSLPITQIVLSSDDYKNGSWSVVLRVHAGITAENVILSQLLQQLKNRLERINSSVNSVDMKG